MNRLQQLKSKVPYIVTLNSNVDIHDSYIIKHLRYTHPCFNKESIGTQKFLPELNGVGRTYFCGSYFKYGFHEDAAHSGANVAKHFGIGL